MSSQYVINDLVIVFSNSSLHKATKTYRRHRKACCCVLNFNTKLYMDVVGRKEVVGVGKTLMKRTLCSLILNRSMDEKPGKGDQLKR